MKGNDRHIQADQIQEDQYRLPDDLPRRTIKSPPEATAGLTVSIWELCVSKYLDDDRKRETLGILGIMTGREIDGLVL